MEMVGRKKKRDRWAGLPVAGESGASFWVPMADLAIMEPGFAICSIELVGGAAGSTGKHGGRTWDNAIHHYDNYFHFICLHAAALQQGKKIKRKFIWVFLI